MGNNRVLPILFNSDMVRAILENRKTTTRRLCKDWDRYTVPDMKFYDSDRRTYAIHSYSDIKNRNRLSTVEKICPICPGDVLYVRETFRPLSDHPAAGFEYAADIPKYFVNSKRPNCCNHRKWIPSIHMPKRAVRIWLKVKDVRVERLHNMTLDDFLAEGVIIPPEAYNDPENAYQQAKNIFKEIWNATVKKTELSLYGGDANPWVWVVEFGKCEKPESFTGNENREE